MTENKASNFIVALVVLVVVLSVVFTWQILSQPDYSPHGTPAQAPRVIEKPQQPAPVLETTGMVGINVVKQTKEAE